MELLNEVTALMPTLRGHQADGGVFRGVSGEVSNRTYDRESALGGDSDDVTAAARDLQALMRAMNDAEIAAVMAESGAVERYAALVRQVATGIAAARSSREFGHGGFAAKRGHRSAVSLVQEVMGVSKAEAARQVRVSEAIVEVSGAAALPDSATCDADRAAQAAVEAELEARARGEGAGGGGAADDDSSAAPSVAPVAPRLPEPWHQPLTTARFADALTTDQFNAIMNGLGQPPCMPRDAAGNPLPVLMRQPVSDDSATSGVERGGGATETKRADETRDFIMVKRTPSLDEADAFDAAAREAWSLAAEQLVGEAQVRTISDLLAHARYVRDQLDPEGAERRFNERFEARSFRMFQTETGATRITWTLDDETALLLTAAHDAALRPRRGGPRFVDSAEVARADALSKDPRTNEQLASDLMADIVRAGVLADAKSVFGTRQAGVRLVQIIDDHGHRAPTAHTEDRLSVLPGRVADRQLCDTESIALTVDIHGNPLSLGRTRRVFTPAQKLALAIRDGGCRWTNCDRPASYTEAHHIDPWSQGGNTDVDRGILLCRYHHLALHDGKSRIIRDDDGEFYLTHPDHPPRHLPPRVPLEYAWRNITIPAPRFHPAAA